MPEERSLSVPCVTFHSRVARGVTTSGKGENLRLFLSRVARLVRRAAPLLTSGGGSRSQREATL